MKENATNKLTIEKTQDGSNTLYSSRFGQTYHNRKGAVSESEHVFFDKNGLNEALKTADEINILEVGLGTGLNLLLLLDKHKHFNSSARIHYHTVEAYPVSARTIESLNYADFLHHPGLTSSLPPLFSYLNNGLNDFEPAPGVSVHVFCGTFDRYKPADFQFDFIFHDAFSPRVNPELWTEEVFEKIITGSRPESILTTYCAASKVRATMAAAGWKVARATGALRKREMTVASPTPEKLKAFTGINEERLTQRFRENDF